MGAVDAATLEAVALRLAEELAVLRRRIGAIETASVGKGIAWRGRWSADVDYQPGDMVQHGAGVWITDTATRAMPGSSAVWARMLKADRRGFHDGTDEG